MKEMLTIKFPGQKTSELMKELSFTTDRPVSYLTRLAELVLQKGPDFLLEAFNFMPPEQIRPDNVDSFDERLEFEKKARKEGQMPVTRVYRFEGMVQGVGFRDFCGMRANGLWGECFAINMKDGSVKVILQGSPKILDKYMADFCQAATKNLCISLPEMSLEKEVPIVRGRALKKLFK